jgi:hypothetical protein
MSSAPAELVGRTLSRSWRWLLPCAFAPPMLVAADVSGQHAVVFPESLALAFGAWVLRRPEITVSRWRIAVLPSVCAAVGVAATRMPGPRWLVAIGVLTFALVLLQLTRCRVSPAVSAGVLPVVFDVREPAYFISVVVLCTIVAATTPRGTAPVRLERWMPSRVAVSWVIGATWIAVAGASSMPPIAVAPPLLVASLEYVVAGAGPGTSWLRRCVLLAAAGLVGASCLRWIPIEWAAGTVAVVVVVLVAIAFALPLAPALAVSLVPFVAEVSDPLTAAGAIALGAAVMHLSGWAVLVAGPRLVHGWRKRRLHKHPSETARVLFPEAG